MRYHVTIGAREFEVELGPEGARVDGKAVEVSLARSDGSPVQCLVVDGATHRVLARRNGKGDWKLRVGGLPVSAAVVDERTREIRARSQATAVAAGPSPILAPMPGMVVNVEVSEGDTVATGQGVVIVEAMKMENELRATGSGVVTRVHVAAGDAVEKDQVLVELGPGEAT